MLSLRWHQTPPAAAASEAVAAVVATGVFDLLHVGHLRFLQTARAAGSRLLLGVEDDVRTAARKGSERPLVPLAERCEMLAALDPVDGVFSISGSFSVAPALAYVELLRPLTPAVLAFTQDDKAEAGKRLVADWLGCRVLVAPRVEGRSTTLLLSRLLRERPAAAPRPLPGPATADRHGAGAALGARRASR